METNLGKTQNFRIKYHPKGKILFICMKLRVILKRAECVTMKNTNRFLKDECVY